MKATYLSLSFGDPMSFRINQFLLKVVFFPAYRNVSPYHWGNKKKKKTKAHRSLGCIWY